MVSVVDPEAPSVSIDALLGVDAGGLADAGLAERLVALHEASARLDAARVETMGLFDTRGVWALDAARNGPGWVTARTGASFGLARSDQALARDLREMPLVAAAFATGRLTRDQVRALTTARVPELADAFAACEQILVEEIARSSVAAGIRFLRRWAAEVRQRFGIDHPDGPTPDTPTERSRVHLSNTLDGHWRLDGDLTGEDGEILRNLIDAQVDQMWRDGVFTADDGLTSSERVATALVEVMVRGSHGGDDDGVARPLLVAVVHRDPYRSTGRTETSPVPTGLTTAGRTPTDLFGLAELEHAGLAHPTDIDRWACEGTIQTLEIHHHPHSHDELRLGRKVRIATRAQRRALRIRDGGCTFPGCHVTASHCVAHHITYWEWGGDTDLDNLVLLCRFHHRAIHDRGFTLTRDHGTVEVTRPDATPLTDAHHTRPDPTMNPIVARPREPDADEALLHHLIARQAERLLRRTRARRASG